MAQAEWSSISDYLVHVVLLFQLLLALSYLGLKLTGRKPEDDEHDEG